MDAQAIAQAKIFDTKSASSAKSIDVALPSGKAVQAKITQITQLTPDQVQQSTHRVKLEVNNTVIQLSAKFSANIPEAGSTVIVQRSNDGQIQLKVISDNQTANKNVDSKPLANTSSNQPVNSQSTDKIIQSAKALLANITAASVPLTSSGDSGKVILKAPVIINASGSSLSAIELALPKGQTLTARVIGQSSSLLNRVIANTSSAPLSNPQNIAAPITAASTQPNNLLTNTALQANSNVNSAQSAPILSNTLTNNTQVATGTSAHNQTTGATTNQTLANTVSTSPTSNLTNSANSTSNTYSARQAPAPVAITSLPTDAKTVTAQPASVIANTQPNSISNTYSARQAPASVAITSLPADAKAVTAQPASVIASTQINPGASKGSSLPSAAQNTNIAQPAATLSSNTNTQSAPVSSSPVTLPSQNTANATPLANNLSNNVIATASPTPSPITSTTIASTTPTATATTKVAVNQTANQALASSAVASSTVGSALNNNVSNSNSMPISSNPSQTASTLTQVNSNMAATAAGITVTNTSLQPNTGAQNAAPILASPSTPQSPSQPISQLSSPATPQTLTTNTSADALTNRQNIPQNLQLNALPSNNAAIKIAVAGQSITLQAPANLPPLISVQITRTEGVQANIQWQQVSQVPIPQLAPPVLSTKQAQIMEHSLRQALPQQIPIAEGINQLVNQTAQFASITSPAQASIDKVTMSIMQLFGVKPGANNSSDTVKRNIQQGGLFTESKLVSQAGGQQGDMKNFLAKLNRLAEQLPTEQKEMLQSTTERMLARVTTNQLTHVQQQHLKTDISNERSFQIDIPVQNNEKLDNVEIELKQRKHMNDEGDFVAIWSVKLHFDLEERGEVDAEVALNPIDNTISTTFLCTQLSTVHEIEQRMNNFKNQLNSQGFEVQTLHCSQGSQAAIANNPISKRIIDIRT